MQAIGTSARYHIIRFRMESRVRRQAHFRSPCTPHSPPTRLTFDTSHDHFRAHHHGAQSTGQMPFFALFGRHPVLIPELEDDDLHQPTFTGCEFVDSLASRLHRVWDSVRESAIRVK
eukprot:5676402-Pleurochrysis_carterae.AAC.1